MRTQALQAALARLDEHQQQVANWRPADGNLKVVATAGSGKSSAAVALAARLVADGDVNPARLVMTTFSNKGGEVMRQRIQALGIRSISRIGTFHALGLRALRTDEGVRAGGPGAKSRWAMSHCLEADAKTRASTTPASWVLWKAIVKKGKVPGSGDKGMNLPVPFEGYAKAVSLFRARGLTPATAPVDEAMLLGCPNIRKAWTMYEEAKAALHVWDFDDVLLYHKNALVEGALWPDADVVMVDEAQDNSKSQLDLALALCGISLPDKKANPGRICLIGDSAQTVHTWRGAYPELFLRAEQELNAKVITLPNNYRSLQSIVDLGNRSVAGRPWALDNAKAARGIGEGGVTLKGGFDSDLDEAMWVGEQIASLVKAGYNPDKFAILARTNAALVNFQAALTSLNVPLVIVGSDSLFGSREAQDIVSYVRLLIYDDVEAVERVVNRPVRFVTRSGIDTLKAEMRAGFSLDAAILRIRHVVSASDARGLDEFARAVATMRRMAWAEVPRRLLTLLGATEGAEASDNSEPDEDRPAVYRAMCNVASRFQDPSDFVRFADKCVDAGRTVSADEGHMTGKTLLSTIHRIKGGQAAVVFLSASEGQLPHWRSVPVGLLDEAAWDHPDMESELRLWYVGVTRAEDALVVTWSKEATKNRRGGPSRFVIRFMQEHLTADDVVDFQNGGTKKKAKRRKGGEDGPMGELDDLDELSEED